MLLLFPEVIPDKLRMVVKSRKVALIDDLADSFLERIFAWWDTLDKRPRLDSLASLALGCLDGWQQQLSECRVD